MHTSSRQVSAQKRPLLVSYRLFVLLSHEWHLITRCTLNEKHFNAIFVIQLKCKTCFSLAANSRHFTRYCEYPTALVMSVCQCGSSPFLLSALHRQAIKLSSQSTSMSVSVPQSTFCTAFACTDSLTLLMQCRSLR